MNKHKSLLLLLSYQWRSNSSYFVHPTVYISIKNLLLKIQWYRLLTETQEFLISEAANPKMYLRIGVLKICSKFTGEHTCRSPISINLQSNLIETALRHECSPVNCCIFSEHLFLGTPLCGCFCYLWLIIIN